MNRRIDNTKLHRRADYFQRIFYLQDYAKEVRMNNIKPILIERYNDAADDVIDNQKKSDYYLPMASDRRSRKGRQMKKKFEKFRERHPDFPMWLSLIALLASIAMPILRKFLS